MLSPLRYPGSKRKLANFIAKSISLNNLNPFLYVEPFAGGASVALHLLNQGAVEKVGLIDKDPLIASLWKAVFFHTDWLINQISTIDISVEKWEEIHSLNATTIKEQAIKGLYLNRTNYSGIIRPEVGPLGGKKQKSDYKIDCRFPRKTLISRIKKIASFRNQIEFVWQVSWDVGLDRIKEKQSGGIWPEGKESIFFYLDPPFFHKADKLYNNYFFIEDHIKLKNSLVDLDHPWVLSYDDVEQAKKLYENSSTTRKFNIIYSIQTNGRNQAKEVIFSNLKTLPPIQNK